MAASVFLQEIWLPYHEERLVTRALQGYNFKISSPDMFLHSEEKLLHSGPIWHGVAIGWLHDITHKVTTLDSSHHRVVGVKYNMHEADILLVSFYAPTAGHDDDFLLRP